MKNSIQTFRLSVISVALLAVFQPVHAEDDELALLTKPDSSISLGLGHWSNDRPQQGIYDGMRRHGTFGVLDVDLVNRNDETGTWLTLRGRNLGLDTGEASLEYLRQGDIGASIEYSRTPRDNPLRFNTGLQGIGTSTLIVSGAGANALPFGGVGLGTTRDQATVGFYKNLMSGLDFTVNFKNEEKKGTRQWGRGGAAEFAVEPIDSNTRQLEATLAYTTERWQLSGGYYGSWYDNTNGMVDTIRNGANPAVVANHIFLSLPLDNEAHQAFLNGGFNFTPSTRGTMKLSYSHATQDQHLPTQDIPTLSLAGSPRNLGGEVNTTLAQFGLTSHVTSDLSLLANLRYHDLQDDTPVARFVQTNAACGSGQCVDNTPFSFKTLTAKFEATYRLPLGYSLTGGAEHRTQDRTVPVSNANGAGGADTQRVVPFRSEVNENTYRLEGRRSLSETVNGSVAYLHAKRYGSSYVSAAAGPGGAPSNRINPIHIADRERDKVRVAVDWLPVDALSLQFAAEQSRDEYTTDAFRRFGVNDGEGTFASVDASYKLGEDWQLVGWYSYDRSKATQFGHRDAAPTAVKEAHLEDAGNSVGLGLRGKATAKVKFGADLQWTKNESRFPETLVDATTGAPIANTSLPDVEAKLFKLALFAEYATAKNATWRFDFIHENWESNDWAWQFSNGAPFTFTGTGAPFTDNTVVTAIPKQVSNFVGMRYNYHFQ